MQRKLGKLAPRHDPRTLRLERYTSRLPTPPATVDWSKKVTSLGMMLNDRIGDCTCATAGHMIQTWTANDAAQVTIADADVLRAYSAVSGYDPATGANDNGAVELDVLKYWQRTGIGGHKLFAFAAIPVGDVVTLRQAVWLFGGAYIGVSLPQLAMDQVAAGRPWTLPSWYDRLRGRGRIIGGHAVSICAYTPTAFYVHTWGQVQPVSLSWLARYADELWAVLPVSDWTNEDRQSPSGFDFATLRADLTAVTR